MIEVKHLEKYYGSDGTVTKALDDILVLYNKS